jgi:hypothetical protein
MRRTVSTSGSSGMGGRVGGARTGVKAGVPSAMSASTAGDVKICVSVPEGG